jgi:hypothetical protein
VTQWSIGIAAILAVPGLFLLLVKRRPQQLMPESLICVELNETCINVIRPEGGRQVVRWARLTKIAIRTTDDGPFDMDLFWSFHEDGSSAASAVFPGGATGEDQLIEALHRHLPNIRTDQIIEAMSSTSNNYFVIWESGDFGDRADRVVSGD